MFIVLVEYCCNHTDLWMENKLSCHYSDELSLQVWPEFEELINYLIKSRYLKSINTFDAKCKDCCGVQANRINRVTAGIVQIEIILLNVQPATETCSMMFYSLHLSAACSLFVILLLLD